MRAWIAGALAAGMVGMVFAQPRTSAEGITAGRQFGRIKIGMTRAEVLAILKAPATEAVLEGDVTESVWFGSARKGSGIRKRDFVAIYFSHETVVQIDGSSPRFKTRGGLSTNSTWAKLASSYRAGPTRKRSYPLDDDQPRLLHFMADDPDAGIGWVQVRYEADDAKPVPGQPIDVIVVHRPGAKAMFGALTSGIWAEPPHAGPPHTEPPVKDDGGGKPSKKGPDPDGPSKPEPKPTTTKPKPDRPMPPVRPKVEGPLSPIKAGDLAPALTGRTVQGPTFELGATLKSARAALVYFWYGADDDCKKLNPRIQEFYSRWGTQGLVVVGVNIGDLDPALAMRDAKLTFPMLADTEGAGPAVDYRVVGFPTAFVVGADGRVIATFSGPQDEPIRKALEKLGFTTP